MRLPIRMSMAAQRDRLRLAVFLAENNPTAARRAAEAIIDGIAALGDHPFRGRVDADGLRELMIPFGQSGYVARYSVHADHIVIARVFHMREDR